MENRKNGFESGIGFVLSAAGSAVGLGNLWGFPYKTANNGGAAFVLLYIACVILIGAVTMICEFHIGRRAGANPVTAYKQINESLGWFGLIGIPVSVLVTSYYSVLGGYTVKYTLNSFSGNEGILPSFSTNFVEVVLFSAVFAAVALVVVTGGVKGGIERMSKTLMPILFLIILGIAIYSLCLGDGVREGLDFYLNPDFSTVSFSSVLAAMGQAFFSLSLGMGTMIAYGSYTGKEISIVKSTAIICVFDTLVALLSGLAVFPAVAHFNPALLDNSEGVGLIFGILPEVFASMGEIGRVVSFLFFAMVAIAALTSVVSLIEVSTQFIIQALHFKRRTASLGVIFLAFSISVPVGVSLGQVGIMKGEGLSIFGMDLLRFIDEVTSTLLIPLCALFACIAVGYLIGPRRAIREIEDGGARLGILKRIFPTMVRFVTPALILTVGIGGIINKLTLGEWFVVLGAVLIILSVAAVYFLFLKNKDTGTNADEKI